MVIVSVNINKNYSHLQKTFPVPGKTTYCRVGCTFAANSRRLRRHHDPCVTKNINSDVNINLKVRMLYALIIMLRVNYLLGNINGNNH